MAKQPQDHKTKQEKPKAVETTFEVGGREVAGWEVTHRGFTVRVPREAFDDFEFLDELANIQDKRAQRVPAMLRRLVGDDWQVAMDGLRDKTTGRVPIQAGMDYVMELIQAVNPNG